MKQIDLPVRVPYISVSSVSDIAGGSNIITMMRPGLHELRDEKC